MHNHYDAIYLSPHLDDVALSCGGQIYEQTAAGQSMLIVTVTAGDPPDVLVSDFARTLHQRWQLAGNVVAIRRAEDIAACQRLGASYLHLDIPDCIYRVHPATGQPLYTSKEAIFGPLHPAESGLITKLAQHLAALPPCGRVIIPLTIGHHVDHQLTRAAAEQWQEIAFLYYEDYPYVQQPGTLEEVIGSGSGWDSQTIPLSPAALQARFDAIACFQSQLSSFFTSLADLERQVGGYAAGVGGERLWQKQPT